MKFRTDINGLRTYAVLAVIIFHFNKSWLPGGFAGVDVFFVISGYLMTSIIFRGLEKQSFSLWKFYSARIRRIIPALLVLIVVLMVFGYLFLGPIPYADLAKHSGGSLLFISNIMYWQESGYFDAGALEKFLLHTWSLSVEWQFYIIYPVALLVLAKFFSIKALKKILLISTILAFLFAVYASFKWSVASYFLLPTRTWEMLLGGIVFLYPLQLSKTKYKHALELTGLALVILSFFIISENTVWPGYMALLPTMGAFILLQANNEKSLFTNNLVAQKIGLWSYSLYLYHWPILVINHKFDLQLSVWSFLLITTLFSIASYYLIEIKKWKVSLVLSVSIIALLPIFAVYKTNGASYRVDPKYDLTTRDFHQKYFGGTGYPTYEEFFINADNNSFEYFIIGDSYMRQYSKYFEESKIKSKNLFLDGCLIIKNHTQPKHYFNDNGYKCSQYSQLAMAEISADNKSVIFGQAWDTKLLLPDSEKWNGNNKLISFGSNPQEYKDALINSLKEMVSDNDKKLFFLVGQPNKANYNVFECLSKNSLAGARIFQNICPQEIEFKPPVINEVLQDLAVIFENVFYIDPNLALCNQDKCKAIIDGNPVYSDQTHLSIYGADLVGKYIMKEIINIENNSKKTLNNLQQY